MVLCSTNSTFALASEIVEALQTHTLHLTRAPMCKICSSDVGGSEIAAAEGSLGSAKTNPAIVEERVKG
jgi:hypothetical protein